MDAIITYEALYEILRKEKSSSELQLLDKNFFKEVIKYLQQKTSFFESAKEKTSIFSATEIVKTKKQIENTKRLLKELYEKRESKVLQLALLSSRSNIITDIDVLKEERAFYKEILDILNKYRKGILTNILAQNLPEIEEEIKRFKKQSENKLVRIIQAVPKFVGDDLNIYGPYESEDIVNISSKIADLLIKKNKAEQI